MLGLWIRATRNLVQVTSDHGFLPYMNKVIKLPDLLRRARRQLPELLLVLDQCDPLDFVVLRRLAANAVNLLGKGRILMRKLIIERIE